MSAPELDNLPSESGVYHKYARFYDHTFDHVFSRRVHQTIHALQIPPKSQVLELGVGTGTSLAAYPKHAEVTATDLSADMLRFAATRLEQQGWSHVKLQRMDAQQIEFDDNQFDFVTAFHIVSVVPDARRMLKEMLRVCKPGGRIAIVNHFRSERAWLGAMVDCLNPVTRRLGWRTDLRCAELVDDMPLVVDKRYKTSPFSLFTILVGTKTESQASADQPAVVS